MINSSFNNRPKMIELLLKKGANPFIKDYYNKTALDYALEQYRNPKSHDKVELLLFHQDEITDDQRKKLEDLFPKLLKKWENQLGTSWVKMYRLGKPLPEIQSKVKQCWQKPKLVKTIEKNKQFYKCNNMQWVNNLRKY